MKELMANEVGFCAGGYNCVIKCQTTFPGIEPSDDMSEIYRYDFVNDKKCNAQRKELLDSTSWGRCFIVKRPSDGNTEF